MKQTAESTIKTLLVLSCTEYVQYCGDGLYEGGPAEST